MQEEERHIHPLHARPPHGGRTWIAPSAVVEPGAEVADGVSVGHGCVVSGGAVIGRGTVLENNVTLMGDVRIGERNRIFPNCVIGGDPQDVSYRGTRTRVVIGDDNVIREGVTINRASEKEDGETTIGNGNFLMACSHVAHDCRIGDSCILANGTLLGGHVRVHSHASLSGAVAVHHWVTIGGWSFVAGLSRVLHDVPPFMLCEGLPARPRCINVVALRRGGFPAESIEALAEAHRLLYRAKVGLEQAREILRSQGLCLPQVVELVEFLLHQREGRHGRARERRRAA
ncbi:MAG: acyl-ACP--UDP-N-acetylglucosamine O-acyltransferase [Planctomycetia bacterium]|nr:acyl-ACP--UDP-N-acetylglucosamine O-acyltransferase [Planctomycetia bacterium]